MSNFTEIIKVINRMPPEMATEMRQRMTANPEEVESTVRQWDRENPIPRYPTWAEWLCEMGVSKVVEDENGRSKFVRTRKYYSDMDAAVADKLGIKPKMNEKK